MRGCHGGQSSVQGPDKVGPTVEQRAVGSLRADLNSGKWLERNHDIVDLDTAELGARLLLT